MHLKNMTLLDDIKWFNGQEVFGRSGKIVRRLYFLLVAISLKTGRKLLKKKMAFWLFLKG